MQDEIKTDSQVRTDGMLFFHVVPDDYIDARKIYRCEYPDEVIFIGLIRRTHHDEDMSRLMESFQLYHADWLKKLGYER